MKTIKLSEKEITIKSSLSEISLYDFSKFMSIFHSEYEFEVDKIIKLFTIISPLSYDELESLDIVDFKLLSSSLDETEFVSINENVYKPEFIYDNITYKTSLKNDVFSPKVKEINTIEKWLKTKHNGEINYEYIIDIASILFRECDENGIQQNTFEEEDILKRKIIFKDYMSIDYLAPYLMDIHKHFNI